MRSAERTCCICRSKGEKRTLLRLVVQDLALVVDDGQRLPGRGAYVHPTIECLTKMGQAQRWERALRLKGVSLEASQVSRVAMELMARVKGSAETPRGGSAGTDRGRKLRL